MQSVRLKKPLTVRCTRQYPLLLSTFLIAVGLLPWGAFAQDTQAIPAKSDVREKFDIGAGGFYQITNASNGNFIREDTTASGGGLVSFRRPYRPYFGFEANAGYTKFFEAYDKGTVKVQSNVTDVSLAYLLQAPAYYGLAPFFTLGGGVIVFSPISGTVTSLNTTPTHLPTQLLPEFTYSLGLNYPVFGHFGVRGQIRGLIYKTPDFHQDTLNTHTLRTTLEPTLSVYYRF